MSTIIRAKNKRSYVAIDARLLEDAIARRIAAIRSTSLETRERPATNSGSSTRPVVVSEAGGGESDTESAFRSSAMGPVARRLTPNDRPSASSLPRRAAKPGSDDARDTAPSLALRAPAPSDR